MKATKTSSGRWRVQIYDYQDASGKIHKKSFTADTKREAERMAANYKPAGERSMQIREMVERYIALKQPVLSPSSIRGYKNILKHYLSGSFGHLQADKVRPVQIQSWVSDLSQEVSPKTVSNAYGLYTAASHTFYPEIQVPAKLPQRMRAKLYAPTDEDICLLLNDTQRFPELYKAIMLGAFCGLRRGEICALDATDIDRAKGTVSVTKSIVSDGSCYKLKPPKTDDSNRVVIIPPFVMDKLPAEGPVVALSPTALTTAFWRAMNRYGGPRFRFHDLRHFFATRLTYMGIPSRIICDMGGWRTDWMMKRVYVDVADDELKRSREKMLGYFNAFSGDIPANIPATGTDDIEIS